ncbi:zinc finger protein 62 homolog [Anopheles bellator]|uniref:zinc finger protein 62 homolog n=1 Tax=Anopheles bellator TaxID=139047 RepID=UPI0026498D15|nr:zinc finger protein 62 homolog [Anopheles bellator]
MHNFSHQCRLCLESLADTKVLPIADEVLQEKLRLLLDFEIMPDLSWLPTNACRNCAEIIDNFIAFRQKVKSNQDYLNSLMVENVDLKAYGSLESLTESVNSSQDMEAVHSENNDLLPPISVSVASRSFEIVYLPLVEHEEVTTSTSPTFAEVLLPVEDEIKMFGDQSDVQSDTDEAPDSPMLQSDETDLNDSTKKRKSKMWKARGRPRKQCSSSSLSAVGIDKRKRQNFTEQDEQRLKDFYKLVCEICETISDSFSDLLAHYRKEHKTEGFVRCCDAKFKFKTMALQHVHGHLGTIRCDICNKTFLYANSLKLHNLDRHSGPEAKPFKCDKCQRSFARKSILKSHLKSHDLRPCPTCGKILAKPNLASHIESVHGNLPRRVQCPHCLKWYRGKSVLKQHVQHVHLEKGQTFQCDICQKPFPHSRALALHRKRHDESKFECEVCGKQFRKKNSLRRHVAVHTYEQPKAHSELTALTQGERENESPECTSN